MFDYHLLAALKAVEREKSFERAARTLGMTSSAISQRIRLLEERIGGRCFQRNPTIPTPLGKLLCRHAEQVMLLEQKLINDHPNSFPNQTGEPLAINIAIDDDCLSSWFIEVLEPDNEAGPNFHIDIKISDQDHAMKALTSGEVLAAITTTDRAAAGFKCYALGRHIYKATASPRFLRRHFPQGVTTEAMTKAPSLRYSPLDDLQLQWLEQVFDKAPSIPTLTLPSSYGFINACLNDVAWGMNSTLLVDEHLETGQLVELIPNQPLAKPLYWHVSRFVLPALEGMTKRVRAAAGKNLQPIA